jgi:hypothetical protein
MGDSTDRWPFGTTDGTPASRPKVVDMDGVLVAMLRDDAAGEAAAAMLGARGYDDRRLRLYRADQIVGYDEEFRDTRSLTGKVVGAVVDDREAMAEYVAYGREGCSALWVLVPDRDDANAVVRALADQPTVFVWYHGHGRIEAIPMDPGPPV